MNDHIIVLNKVSEGWTESQKGGMLVNTNTLDMIDIAPATQKWFIISDFGNVEGYETRDDAVGAYVNLVTN